MISKRTLEKWRKEALTPVDVNLYKGIAEGLATAHSTAQERILELTRELLDQQLINKKG